MNLLFIYPRSYHIVFLVQIEQKNLHTYSAPFLILAYHCNS